MDNRRKDERLTLAIPVRVQGYLAGGATWEELSTTIDVSQRGACFALNRPIELGHVLRLTLPLPKRLRSFDTSDTSYRVYSLVRFVQQRSAPPHVGVLFFGQYPPRGFQEHPNGRYLLPGDPLRRATAKPQAASAPASGDTPSVPPAAPIPGAPTPTFLPTDGADRRSSPRIDVFVNFMLQLTGAQGEVLQQELTVADNISRGGARVMTTLSFHVGDVVMLQEAAGAFATRAEIRGISRVQSAFERIHLRFLDREAPERLLR